MAKDEEKKYQKVWKSKPDADAGFKVKTEEVSMIANESNYITCNDNGVNIGGSSVSFSCSSDNIRKGALFVDSNDVMRMIPSTMFTCFGDTSVSPPIGMFLSIIEDLPYFLAMLL